jgi:hypothetical protein
MKSFALVTAVSLLGPSSLATARPALVLESRQPAKTRIAQASCELPTLAYRF